MAGIPPTPPSPGVGLRRKGPGKLPKLDPSAFSTPPTSSTAERFPLPSPSTIHPGKVIDANVLAYNDSLDLSQWQSETGQVLADRIAGVVLALSNENQSDQVSQASTKWNNIVISVTWPFSLTQDPPTLPETSKWTVPVSYSTVFTKSTDNSIPCLKWALEQGRPVDIDVQVDLTDALFEQLEDLLTKATESPANIPPIVISNLLPPPHDLEVPIVKLMNSPPYRAFQARTAALSLFPSVHIKYLPPSWNVPTPSVDKEAEVKQKNEWKRRIRMYLGPVVEAFGYQRMIFGSSPSGMSKAASNAGDWYQLARESLAELGVEQEAIDAVFSVNAKRVYGQ